MKIDEGIDSRVENSESVILDYVVDELRQYRKDLGRIGFKGYTYRASLESESTKSHQHNCTMDTPMGAVKTELGDLIISVDHILRERGQKSKILNGNSSIIQVKREVFAKRGLSARQLYLMTQWPEFSYGHRPWKFNVFADTFAFYMFVLDPSAQEPKSSILSASMLTKFLGISKEDLLNNIRGTVPFSNLDILKKENIAGQPVPSFFAPYLLSIVCLSLGSSSLEFRRFLNQFFFPSMEEVEDCNLIAETQGVTRSYTDKHLHNEWPNKPQRAKKKDESGIRAVRLKLTLERLE